MDNSTKNNEEKSISTSFGFFILFIVILKFLIFWFYSIYSFFYSVFYSWQGLLETLILLLLIILTPFFGGIISLIFLIAVLELTKTKCPITIGKFRFNWKE
jgi:hypothetical protein